MKGKKLLLSIILIGFVVMLMFNTNTYAARGSWTLGAEKIREGVSTRNNREENDLQRYSYEAKPKPILKIVDRNAMYQYAIYCLKAGKGFGSADGIAAVDSEVTYNLYYDMVTEKSQVNSIIHLSDSNYGSVLWLLDNIYLPKQTPIETRQQARNNLLQKAFQSDFDDDEGTYSNVNELYITDDDIEVVQQWALWYFTNADEANRDDFRQYDSSNNLILPALQVNTTGTGTHLPLEDQGPDTDWLDPIKQGQARQNEAAVLYNYLITEAIRNSNYSKVPTTLTINRTTNPKAKQVEIGLQKYIVAGPFKIDINGNTGLASFTGEIKDKVTGTSLSYKICDANGVDISSRSTLADVIGNGEFYVKVEKSSLTNSDVEGIKLQIAYTTNSETKATFWTVDGSDDDQPVVVVERTPQPGDDEIEVSLPEFDLALRKYIKSISRNGEETSVLPTRVPNISTEPLRTKSDTTAEYKHKKDPVLVQTDDLVKYAITVYNEGEIKGRATQIIDYLPEGLVFEKGITTDKYDFIVDSNNNRRLIIQAKNDYVHNLNEYDNGNTLDSETIEFWCKVTKHVSYGRSEVLTNIAEITEAYDVNNVKMYREHDDRDSIPDTMKTMIPSDTDLPNYKGNSDNIDKLDQSTYFYKGQEDDDDFEKLEVITPEFDLALRKFITKIDGEDVEISREPQVDTTDLDNKTPLPETGEISAYYAHPKNPLTVRIGSKIVYTIRVYNEGDKNGTATIVYDYLPEELELVPLDESQINTDNGWVVTGNGRLASTHLLENTTIYAYNSETMQEPDYKDIQIECRVKEGSEPGKVLTNIAQIGEDTDDDRDSTPDNLVAQNEDLPTYKGRNSNRPDLSDSTYCYRGKEDDDDFEKVQIYKTGFDLALRKFITHIDGNEVEVSREPKVDVTPLVTGNDTTAIYDHPKNPLTVKIGSRIIYTIRIYNEGDKDGTATIIEDYLPEELEFISPEESQINREYEWSVTSNGRLVTTHYLENEVIRAFDPETMTVEPDHKDVKIECRVKAGAEPGKILTNIAQIDEDTDDDRDSIPNSVDSPSEDLPPYNKHYEDDDDFEKVKVYQPKYDLALRKFIVEINGVAPEISREPQVDVSPLIDDDDETTTAIYTHPKNPLLVKTGDIVVYTIRIYNEGEFDAYAEEVKDNIPEGLEFIIDNEINAEYRWRLSQDQKYVVTDYLSKAEEEAAADGRINQIKAFEPTMTEPDHKDVKIAFKVVEPNTSTRILTNIAEIKEDDNDDIDSTPDNDVPDEDDIDVEHVKLRYFDLALRKFITKVESKNGENLPIETDTTTDVSREPKVEIDEEGHIKYVHPKDPVIVANSDIVIYTLRVYNEGTIDGYAEEIKDDVPQGLELVPEHEINLKYGWIMYDEDGNSTDDPTKAKTIRTTYLSEANSVDNIIRAFDRETMTEPDHKDVQVAFKVIEKNANTDRIIINTAEISDDSDDDIDSTPDNDVPDEDDIDKEYVKVKYFDLALAKWVSKAILIENGETQVIETGYDATSPKIPVKLELKPNQINSIVLKYEYGIQITNEGQIAGYAKEIADYVPEGLEFIPEDNPLWTLKDGNKIVTRQLEDKLLQPGESTIITVVFKWKNSKDNFGTKINWAEISEDYNEKEAEDIDSTPDNLIPEEDDIDYAPVVLIPKTGGVALIIILPIIVITVLASGIVLIKKYVI